MSVTLTLPQTLSPTNITAAPNTVADAAPDQATGFAQILRAAGNRAAGANVASDSGVAEAETTSELLVANAATDALAAVEMIAPWIVPLLPPAAAAAQTPTVAGGPAASAGAAMQVTPSARASTTVDATPLAATPIGGAPFALMPAGSLAVNAMPDDAAPLASTPLVSAPALSAPAASASAGSTSEAALPELTRAAATATIATVQGTPLQANPRSGSARSASLTAAQSASTPAFAPGARAAELAASASSNQTAPDFALAGENAPPPMSAAAPPRGLTQTPADASDAAAGKVAVSQDPELPPVIDRSVRAPQVHADLQPGAAATVPVMSPANAEADRATRETSAARAEATVALSSASIGSATPPAMREAPAIMQAIDLVVASPGWQEDVAQKLTHFVSLRATTAEIRLNPADLGPIGVTISYADDQAKVMITAAQPATRDALEQALPHLKEMLAQQGITLSEAGVRDRRESMPQWADADPRRGYSDRRDDAPGARTDTAAGSASAATRTPRLIDTFA